MPASRAYTARLHSAQARTDVRAKTAHPHFLGNATNGCRVDLRVPPGMLLEVALEHRILLVGQLHLVRGHVWRRGLPSWHAKRRRAGLHARERLAPVRGAPRKRAHLCWVGELRPRHLMLLRLRPCSTVRIIMGRVGGRSEAIGPRREGAAMSGGRGRGRRDCDLAGDRWAMGVTW